MLAIDGRITPRKSISSPTPADTEISAISDQLLFSSSGTTSSSQNFLTRKSGPMGQVSIARKARTSGTVAATPIKASSGLHEKCSSGG